MDRVDIASFIFTSFVVAWLADISGMQMVACQLVWISTLWAGKKLIDHWINRRTAMASKFKVTYQLTSLDASRFFDTRAEAEAFASDMGEWRRAVVQEVPTDSFIKLSDCAVSPLDGNPS